MAKDKKKKKKSEDEEDEVEDVEEIDEKKKKKKKSKDKDEEIDEKEEEGDEEEEGRKSRKDKKKKKKKKEKDSEEECEDDAKGKESIEEEEGDEEEEGRKSRKDKKKKKKKKEKDSEEECEDDVKGKDNPSTDLEGVTNDDDETDDDGNDKEKGKSAFEKSELFVLVTSEKEFNRETPRKVKKLIAEGANVDLRGEFQETYLHALMGPKPDGTDSAVLAVLFQLTEAGLDVNAKDTEGFTPLHIAVLNDLNPRIVNALSKVGADPCALNNQDQDAMDLCELDTIRDGT